MNRRIFLLGCTLCLCASLSAQQMDFGGQLGVDYTKRLFRHADWKVEGDVRLDGGFTSLDRAGIGSGFSYRMFHKKAKIGISANYILKNRTGYMEQRLRLKLDAAYTLPCGSNFRLNNRLRLQATFYDESLHPHKWNPKTYLRERIQAEYRLFQSPLKVYASEECFLRLYHPDACFADCLRTTVGVRYRMQKDLAMGLYVRYDREIQVKSPESLCCIGFQLSFK